ncbi:MAG: hypothetical protein AMXMBFR33_43710 [Candidatus Xenobia bacterium]|jgi:hypothetical protein
MSIDGYLVSQLRRAGLRNALVSFNSPRFRTLLKRPGSLMREGWRLAPEGGASYVIGDGRLYGQQLTFDARLGTLTVRTFYRETSQEVVYDVLKQRVLATR